MAKEMKFEEALKRLEEILGLLEKGNYPLEKALKLFEEGTQLSGLCIKKLSDAQKKVQILTHDNSGEINTEPFELKSNE